MAGKEAIFIVLDVGYSMNEPYSGDPKKTRLQVCVDCIKLMLMQKLFNAKTHEIGLIVFGSHEAEDGNTIYIQEVSKPNMDFVKNVIALGDQG